MDASVVYITCKDAAEAKSIAKETIENRLAACGNIQQNVTSIFLWKGKVDEENEVTLLLKTRTALVNRIRTLVKKMHSYECPCIINYKIEGNPEFIRWIFENTQS